MPGGYGRGYRYRWWYRATGLPGWMRFGYPPCPIWYSRASYLKDWLEKYSEVDLEEKIHMLEEELEATKKKVEEIKKKDNRR